VPPVFLLDVDNTLLDNDALKKATAGEIERIVGADRARRFWRIYEEIRSESGGVDYPATLEQVAREFPNLPDERLGDISRALFEAPFARYLFPRALEVIERLRTAGAPVILSDGDPVYQPLKIERSGLARAARGNVLVYPHKEDHLDEVIARYPSPRYVQVDDKASLLAATKTRLDGRVTTIHVRQGHYTDDPPQGPPPDMHLDRIGQLLELDLAQLGGG
jgi:FMN phosphatase YigB (HAD superfamily)